MRIVRRLARGERLRPYGTEACGSVLRFEGAVVDDERALVCVVPDDHPQAAAIRRLFNKMPGHEVQAGGAGEAETDAPVPVLTPPSLPVEATAALRQGLIGIAKARGWSDRDLEGVGNGHPGEQGGRSATSGLTLTEMALASPPPAWDPEDETWPWELEGWSPPGLSWKPPYVAPTGTPTVTDPSAPGGSDAPEGEGEDPGDAPKAPEGTPEGAPEGEDPDGGAPDGDPLVAAGYPAEYAAVVRSLIRDAASRVASGRPLHVNKANFILETANKSNGTNYPRLTDAQLTAILETA